MLDREFSGSGAHSKRRAFGQCVLWIGLKALIEPREEIRKPALDIFVQNFGWVEVKFEDYRAITFSCAVREITFPCIVKSPQGIEHHGASVFAKLDLHNMFVPVLRK